MFPVGITDGKIVNLSFPFETVNTLSDRNSMMGTIIDYFFLNTVATSIEENPIEKFSVYPNPSSGIFNVKFAENKIGQTLTVIDLTGKIVFNKEGVLRSNLFFS